MVQEKTDGINKDLVPLSIQQNRPAVRAQPASLPMSSPTYSLCTDLKLFVLHSHKRTGTVYGPMCLILLFNKSRDVMPQRDIEHFVNSMLTF